MSLRRKDLYSTPETLEYSLESLGLTGYSQEQLEEVFVERMDDLESALSKYHSKIHVLTQLIKYQGIVAQEGICIATVEAINDLHPGIINDEYTLASFTELPSTINLEYTLESIGDITTNIMEFVIKHLGVIIGLIAAIISVILGRWLFKRWKNADESDDEPDASKEYVISKVFEETFNTPLDHAIIDNIGPYNPKRCLETLKAFFLVIEDTTKDAVELFETLEKLVKVDVSEVTPGSSEEGQLNGKVLRINISSNQIHGIFASVKKIVLKDDLILLKYTKKPLFDRLKAKGGELPLETKYFKEHTPEIKIIEDEHDHFWVPPKLGNNVKPLTTTTINFYTKGIEDKVTTSGVPDHGKINALIKNENLNELEKDVNDLKTHADRASGEVTKVKEDMTKLKDDAKKLADSKYGETLFGYRGLYANPSQKLIMASDEAAIVWPENKEARGGVTKYTAIAKNPLLTSSVILTAHSTMVSEAYNGFKDLCKVMDRIFAMHKQVLKDNKSEDNKDDKPTDTSTDNTANDNTSGDDDEKKNLTE